MPLKDLEDKKDDVLNRTIAQDVFKELGELRGLATVHGKRWGIELLQNALDTAKPDGVDVSLTAAESELQFTHNGKPFQNDELIHLIYHGSTKVGEQGKSVRLGTGFLSTHLLSPRVSVNGSLSGKERFNFVLDRDAKTVDELLEKMKDTWNQLAESLVPDSSTDTTIYKYRLDSPDSLRILNDGVELLRTTVPYTFAFDASLNSITITDKEGKVTLSRGSFSDQVLQVSVKNGSENQPPPSKWMLIAQEEDVTVVLPLVKKDDVLETGDVQGLPKFYYPLPLTGTVIFPSPVLVGSPSFVSTTSRLGALLTSAVAEESIRKNRRILDLSNKLLDSIISAAGKQGVKSLCNLARLHRVDAYPDWLDSDWTHQYASALIAKLRNAEILVTHAGELIRPADALIPFVDGTTVQGESFWNICKDVYPSRVPSKTEFELWSSALVTWSSYLYPTNPKPEQLGECLTVEELAKQVDGKGNMTNVGALLSEVKPLDWLSDLVKLILALKKNILLETWKLLPNQNGDLAKSVDLFKDPGISDELKDIAESLGISARSQLISKDFQATLTLKTMTEESLLLDTINQVKELARTQFADTGYQDTNVRLFSWLASTDRIDNLRDSYPIITRKMDDGENNYVEELTKERSFIAPPSLLAPATKKYVDVFPGRDVLSDIYSKIKVEEAEKLRKNGIVFSDYVYDEETILDDDLIRNLSVDELAEDEIQHKSMYPIRLKAIPFLKGAGSITDKARSSRKEATSFLRFILEYAINIEHSWREPISIECGCGKNHEIYPSAWLNVLRTIEWVPVGRGEEERPSSENLGPIFKAGLIDLLRRPEVSHFLGVLGVNASVILTSSKSKKERIDLDNAYNRLLVAANLDPSQLKRIADAYSDVDIRTKLENALQLKRRIQTNQEVGKVVEKIIRESFARRLPKDSFAVERVTKGSDVKVTNLGGVTPTGQDEYEVEQEEDYLDEEGRELLIKVEDRKGQHLIEIKSTYEQSVRMTLPQAEEAVRSGNAFTLCAVKLHNDILGLSEQDREKMVVQSARFLNGIGSRLKDKLDLVDDYRRGEAKLATAAAQDIEVDFQKSTIRIKVWEQVWSGGEGFESFVKSFNPETSI